MKKNTTYEERKANGICPYCGREKAERALEEREKNG